MSMSTEFTAQSAIELTQDAADSALVQAIVTRSEADPFTSFEDVHAELRGVTLWLDVYGTSFNCHDQMRATLARLARFAVRPFAVTGVAEGEEVAWYFGPRRRDTIAFEMVTKASAIAQQLGELRGRMTRNTDPRLSALQSTVRECTRLLQRAVKPLCDTSKALK
jgi:hypothetical protein